ncbi:MAG: hypothetical protein EOO51_14485 [Flavobacterium sp.]|nr:MAG: hypothetical protein EOO51_14485 [Flavobacterium sp.]
MKTKFIAFFALCAITLAGCKNEKSVDDLDVVKPEVVDDTFKVDLKVIVAKDDDFALFYTEDGTTDFKNEPLWTKVKGNPQEQDIVYTLPKDVFPTQLRLDLGLKEDQSDVTLKSVTLEYKDKKRVIAGPELAVFFRPDLTKCSFDAATGIVKAVVKDGKRQGPSLYPQEVVLQPEIEKLAK